MFQDFRSVAFSEILEHNAYVETVFSPKGNNFASAVQCQLLVWDTATKKMLHRFICSHSIRAIQFSPDSELIYCSMPKQNLIQVWNLKNPLWKCKINECPRAADVCWAPDSRHLLVISEFNIKITVWSLVSSANAVIESPKSVENCLAFSSCDRYLAVAERRNCEDYIGVYTCETWELLKCFSVDTKDLSGIYFCPSDLVIAVLESATLEPKVIFYSIDGRQLGRYARTNEFGFTSISWSSNGEFVAIGDFWGEVTVLQATNYTNFTSFQLLENLESENVVLYKNTTKLPVLKAQTEKDVSTNWELYEVVKNRPVAISFLSLSSEKTKTKYVKCGVQSLYFNHDGQYLAAINGSATNVLYIFDMRKLKLSDILVHQHELNSISWHPEKPILAICTGTSTLDVWTPSGCISVISPFTERQILIASWCPSQDCLLVDLKDCSSVLYLPQPALTDDLDNFSTV